MRYPPVSDEEITQARELRAWSFSIQEIASLMRRAKSTVYWMLREKRRTKGNETPNQ
jgi:hypothetical protein